MKVAVLWTKLSGYMNSCLRALAETPGVELFVAYQEATPDAPFSNDQFQWMPRRYAYASQPNERQLVAELDTFRPEVMIVASWHLSAYRAACRRFRNRAVRVCAMDNQWEGTLKQWLGVLTSPLMVRKLFDATFVAGERQAVFARRLGFTQDRVWRGMYSCDVNRFEPVYRQRQTANSSPDVFLYVGRLSPEKGFDTLLAAYRLYREQSRNPWPLLIAGEGPLRNQLEGVPGVNLLGFIQPAALPEVFGQASCFVLPSHWEPWGVVIHEAAASGLPIICTSLCGAAVHLVQDGYNGYLTESGDAQSLAQALRRVASLDVATRRKMSEASYSLSLQFSPERWAKYVRLRGSEMIGRLGQEIGN
jgi:glycosyltransferase involved in cell wall biosynthesis